LKQAQKEKLVQAFQNYDCFIATLKVSPSEGARICQVAQLLANEVNGVEVEPDEPHKQPIENLTPIKGL
jgi:hypothetical protein